jgi:hypothetical protein
MALTMWQTLVLLLNCYAVARLAARITQSMTLEHNTQSSYVATISAAAFLWVGGIVLLTPAVLIVSSWVDVDFETWPSWVRTPAPFAIPAIVYSFLFAQVLYARRMSFRLLRWALLADNADRSFAGLLTTTSLSKRRLHQQLRFMAKQDLISYSSDGRLWEPNTRLRSLGSTLIV